MNTERNKYSLKKNDLVEVIAGRDKGKSGKIVKINAKTGRVTVEKINMVKKHMKPTQKNPQGGIMEKEIPIHYSNVLLMCPKCNRGVRHGYKLADSTKTKEAQKIRVCKKCKGSLELTK